MDDVITITTAMPDRNHTIADLHDRDKVLRIVTTGMEGREVQAMTIQAGFYVKSLCEAFSQSFTRTHTIYKHIILHLCGIIIIDEEPYFAYFFWLIYCMYHQACN